MGHIVFSTFHSIINILSLIVKHDFLTTIDKSVLPLLPKPLLPKHFFAQAPFAQANIAQVGFCPSDYIAQVVTLPK